jgi:hypothetical protein
VYRKQERRKKSDVPMAGLIKPLRPVVKPAYLQGHEIKDQQIADVKQKIAGMMPCGHFSPESVVDGTRNIAKRPVFDPIPAREQHPAQVKILVNAFPDSERNIIPDKAVQKSIAKNQNGYGRKQAGIKKA